MSDTMSGTDTMSDTMETVEKIIRLQKNLRLLREKKKTFRWQKYNDTWKQDIIRFDTTCLHRDFGKEFREHFEKHVHRLETLLLAEKKQLISTGFYPHPPILPSSHKFVRKHHFSQYKIASHH